MKEFIAFIIALAAPLLFPGSLTFVLVAIASVIVPPVGLLAGVLSDALYYVPSVGIPYATLIGLALTLGGYVVRQFIKTRIMSA
jgi:hypothetical protein